MNEFEFMEDLYYKIKAQYEIAHNIAYADGASPTNQKWFSRQCEIIDAILRPVEKRFKKLLEKKEKEKNENL